MKITVSRDEGLVYVEAEHLGVATAAEYRALLADLVAEDARAFRAEQAAKLPKELA